MGYPILKITDNNPWKGLPHWLQHPKVHHWQAQVIQDLGQPPGPVALKW